MLTYLKRLLGIGKTSPRSSFANPLGMMTAKDRRTRDQGKRDRNKVQRAARMATCRRLRGL